MPFFRPERFNAQENQLDITLDFYLWLQRPEIFDRLVKELNIIKNAVASSATAAKEGT